MVTHAAFSDMRALLRFAHVDSLVTRVMTTDTVEQWQAEMATYPSKFTIVPMAQWVAQWLHLK
jgi:phosphoribosylpyrophosphate synthetase